MFFLCALFLPLAMTHRTKSIILRSIKYGETSLVVTAYTELFGLQTYIVKGVRKATKKSSLKTNYFQPAALLAMEVHHNELKNIQFIKEYEWCVLYNRIFFDVVRNAVAVYISEILLHCIKQPEANADIFTLAEESLLAADGSNDAIAANIPLFFTLHFAGLSGFRLQGAYSETTPVLDLQEGVFVETIPVHNNYLKNEEALITYLMYQAKSIDVLSKINLNQNARRNLLQAYQQYLSLHIPDMIPLKTLQVLREVL